MEAKAEGRYEVAAAALHAAVDEAEHSVPDWVVGAGRAVPYWASAARCAYTIPGHSALISHVKFQPEHGHYLMTASYDNKVKLWSMRDHSLIKTMEGHEGRVMCADASDDGKYFATSAMDRTWKLWGR